MSTKDIKREMSSYMWNITANDSQNHRTLSLVSATGVGLWALYRRYKLRCQCVSLFIFIQKGGV